MMTKINLDSTDHRAMRALMDNADQMTGMYYGYNQDGEPIMIWIKPDRIICDAAQKNGWLRETTYWRDGTQEEVYTRYEDYGK